MTSPRVSIQKYAMHFGTYMGIYWIVKFCFFPLGIYTQSSLLLFLFIVLTLSVPFMGYYYARMFRDKVCGRQIGFLQSWVFMVFMYMFAAILTAVAHYIYFRFIDNGLIMNSLEEYFQTSVSQITFPGKDEYVDQVTTAIGIFRSLSAIEITMQFLSSNIVYCSLIALITAPFVMRKNNLS